MTQALDELAGRVRDYYAPRITTIEKRMFGGIAFMVHGNMAVAPVRDGTMMVRVGKDAMPAHLKRPGCRQMEMQGRKMGGFVEVDGDVMEDDDTLAFWLEAGLAFTLTLPPK